MIVCVMAMFLFTACESESSEDVNQDRIFTTYEILYLQDQDKTVARALFTFGNAAGTRLELSQGASVMFNNQTIPFKDLLGHYELELSGLVNSGTFDYTDLNGNDFTNSFSIDPIEFNQSAPDTINRSSSYSIDWIGNPVGSGASSVVVTVVPNNIGQSKLFIEADEGATSVILEPTILMDIDPQPGKLFIERKDVTDVIDGTSAGGVQKGNFRAMSKSITIE